MVSFQKKMIKNIYRPAALPKAAQHTPFLLKMGRQMVALLIFIDKFAPSCQ
jgi:hypothetical protein